VTGIKLMWRPSHHNQHGQVGSDYSHCAKGCRFD